MTESGHGAVAVHRWFAGGEGWACHPWFAGRERELVAALDGPLRQSAGEFSVSFRGGVLLGDKFPDPDCPDPKARDRHPFILRAVHLAAVPNESQHFEAMQQLRALPLPVQPGHLTGLQLRDLSPPPGTGNSALALALMVVLGLGVLVAVLVIVAVLAFSGDRRATPVASRNTPPITPSAPPPSLPPVSPNEVPAPTPSADDLQPDPAGEVPYLNDRTRSEFLRQANRAGKYDHPYVAFLREAAKRLPEAAPKCRSGDEVLDGLRRLLEHLRPGRAVPSSVAALREAIDGELDYDAWRRGPGQKDYADRHKPLPEELRRHVEKFRRPSAELAAASRRMAELLRQWDDPDAGDPRPLAVIDHFLTRLSRPTDLPQLDHPRVVFLRRLPSEPVAEGQTFDDAEDLARALRHLLYLLDRDYRLDPLPARELIDRIGEQMRYGAWREAHSREHFRDEEQRLDPRIERACRRFE